MRNKATVLKQIGSRFLLQADAQVHWMVEGFLLLAKGLLTPFVNNLVDQLLPGRNKPSEHLLGTSPLSLRGSQFYPVASRFDKDLIALLVPIFGVVLKAVSCGQSPVGV